MCLSSEGKEEVQKETFSGGVTIDGSRRVNFNIGLYSFSRIRGNGTIRKKPL